MRYSWSYRRSNPTEFPILCKQCDGRRFKLEADFKRHNEMTSKHSKIDLLHVNVQSGHNPRRIFKIESIISEKVLPDDNYRRLCKSTVKTMGTILKHNLPLRYRPAEVIKAGSTGKGTSIKGNSDVDLVFFLPDAISTIQQFESNREQILKDVETTLRQAHYSVLGRSTKAVQARVKCNEHGSGIAHTIDIDILPAVNLHTDDRTKDEIYKMIKDSSSDERKFFTPSLTKWQRDFVKRDRPEKLKRLIRFVKYWKNNMIALTIKPGSYFFELVIIHLWRTAGSPLDFDFNSALAYLMKTLARPQNIGVEFDGEFYRSSMKQSHITPYVIDPVNPYSDVMAGYTRWQTVANCAAQFMMRREMQGVIPGF